MDQRRSHKKKRTYVRKSWCVLLQVGSLFFFLKRMWYILWYDMTWDSIFFLYSPKGKKIRSKSQLVRSLSDVVDLSTFDYMTGKVNSVLLRRNRKKAQSEGTRGLRNDTSLTSPIRQTASIFKQPVTIIKSQESKVRQELKHGRQEKPRQV